VPQGVARIQGEGQSGLVCCNTSTGAAKQGKAGAQLWQGQALVYVLLSRSSRLALVMRNSVIFVCRSAPSALRAQTMKAHTAQDGPLITGGA
jgi:hypothetical protein